MKARGHAAGLRFGLGRQESAKADARCRTRLRLAGHRQTEAAEEFAHVLVHVRRCAATGRLTGRSVVRMPTTAGPTFSTSSVKSGKTLRLHDRRRARPPEMPRPSANAHRDEIVGARRRGTWFGPTFTWIAFKVRTVEPIVERCGEHAHRILRADASFRAALQTLCAN